jgi:hypothetical protein
LAWGKRCANEWVYRLTGVLNQALGDEQYLPERKERKLEEVLRACPELEPSVDGTQRRIFRPQDKAKREHHYSGKKGTTVKNNILTKRRHP